MSTFKEDSALAAALGHMQTNITQIVNKLKSVQDDIDSINAGIAALAASPNQFLKDAAVKVAAQFQEELEAVGGVDKVGESLIELSKVAGLEGTAQEIRVTKGGEVVTEKPKG